MEENRISTSVQTGSNIVQYIVVKIGDEQYGINIKYVDNIVRMQGITRVPKSQVYYRGVINLRGEIIPVMSVRLRLGLESDVFTNKTRIIIIKSENATVGLIVDEVKEVVNLDDDTVERASYDANDETSGYISGIGKSDGELITLLDIHQVLTEKENI